MTIKNLENLVNLEKILVQDYFFHIFAGDKLLFTILKIYYVCKQSNFSWKCGQRP